MNYSLTRIAATLIGSTKVAAKAALKAAGLPQSQAAELLAERSRIMTARAAKRSARAVNNPGTRTLMRTPAARLDVLRRKVVGAAAEHALRIGVNDTMSVSLTSDPALVGWSQSAEADWDKYRGSYKGWACNYKVNTVTVPADWRVRVQRRGLAEVDGMLTLDAAPVEAAGCELFAASWLVQRRGNTADLTRGYIARAGAITYHGATIDQALSGIARKARELAFSARLAGADLTVLVASCPDARVSVADARLSGACEYGIKSWCASVNLPFDAGSATLAEVYAAYQREPRPEAHATILRVLRRNRAAIAA